MLKPRPVPLPISLVVKKGSKARALTSGRMPIPVSRTAIAMQRAAGRPPSGRTFALETRSVPPFGIASRALTARFRIAVWS
jgi:hypothetical protein